MENKTLTGRKKKQYKEDELNSLEIKNKEKTYLHEAFNYLCELEQEPSSDDNSKEKIYKKKIEEQVKKKKMNFNNIVKKKQVVKKVDKKNEQIDLYRDPQNEEEKLKMKNFGEKGIRKVLHKLSKKMNKEEIKLMIWEVDVDLDGYISYEEYERMYKRCVLDKDEKEPKKLYYLVQFLMFDKEKKGYITIEDTLEIICARHPKDPSLMDDDINAMFCIEEKDDKGKPKMTSKLNETLTYDAFADRMHSLSLRKRDNLMNKKKIFCDRIKEDVIRSNKK